MKHHKIWKIQVVGFFHGSVDGESAMYWATQFYLIESKFKNGILTLKKRALKMAGEDGFIGARVVACGWINSPHITTELSDGDAKND
jgi:hypothetical protein